MAFVSQENVQHDASQQVLLAVLSWADGVADGGSLNSVQYKKS